MTAAVPDLESLGAVRPEDAMAYLASRGWRRLDEVRRMARWLQPEDGGLEVAVPLEPRFVDFAERVRDLVLGISEAEDRSPESVLRDLLNVQADAVRIQVREGAALDGSIPLDDAVNLVDGARGVLVAAASSVLEPRPRFSGGRPPLVREYLTTVRPSHLQFVEPTKRYADVIVPHGGRNQPAFDVLMARVREQLAGG